MNLLPSACAFPISVSEISWYSYYYYYYYYYDDDDDDDDDDDELLTTIMIPSIITMVSPRTRSTSECTGTPRCSGGQAQASRSPPGYDYYYS